MKYNVYDFDKTIYNGDSTKDFYFYCIGKYPAVLLVLPKACLGYLKYKTKKYNKTRFKEEAYRFLKYIPDIDTVIQRFWIRHQKKMKQWYLKQHQDNDIIISASPTFLLQPICNKLHIALLIASKVDSLTGKTESENCSGIEKVRRLIEIMPDCKIATFYSDSYSDSPLAELAERSVLVKGDKLYPW